MFNPGEVVRLRTGSCPILVCARSLSKFQLRGVYLSSITEVQFRCQFDFELYTGELTKEHLKNYEWYRKNPCIVGKVPQLKNMKEEIPMIKLYETNETPPRFGTKLGVNSVGLIVLEIKGAAGEVVAFEPKDITEVVPYTVAIRFLEKSTTSHRTDQTYQYLAKKDQVKVGDLLMLKGSPNLARVKAIDTRCNTAKVQLEGRKIATEEI